MKQLLVCAVAIGLAGSASLAQSKPARAASRPSPDELKKKYEEKLAAPFLKKANWFTDYDAAREEAKKTEKLIFGYFSRSYAPCGYCTNVEAGALSDDRFSEFAKNFVLLNQITTQIPDRKNDDLLALKGGAGYPYIAFMDADGDVVAVHRSQRTIEEFTATAARAGEALALKSKSAEGDTTSRFEWFMFQAETFTITFAAAAERAKDLAGLDAVSEKKVNEALLNLEVQDIKYNVSRKLMSMKDAVDRFTALFQQKRIPTNRGPARYYFSALLGRAAEARDAALYEQVLGAATERHKGEPGFAALLKTWEKRLVSLNEASASRPAAGK